jgi:hypothetical protein
MMHGTMNVKITYPITRYQSSMDDFTTPKGKKHCPDHCFELLSQATGRIVKQKK